MWRFRLSGCEGVVSSDNFCGGAMILDELVRPSPAHHQFLIRPMDGSARCGGRRAMRL